LFQSGGEQQSHKIAHYATILQRKTCYTVPETKRGSEMCRDITVGMLAGIVGWIASGAVLLGLVYAWTERIGYLNDTDMYDLFFYTGLALLLSFLIGLTCGVCASVVVSRRSIN
jgi:hypothetical protein